MERLNAEGIVTDLVVRLRRERDLIEQIKSDYRELNRLKEKVAEESGKQGRKGETVKDSELDSNGIRTSERD